MKKLTALLLLVLVWYGCKPPASEPTVKITLTNNNQSVKITGFDPLVLNEIVRDTTINFERLIEIYKMPADTDMKDFQPVQPGRYVVKNSDLLFTPDTPFAKHRVYFMRYYRHSESVSVWDFVKGKRTAAKLRHTDLIFTP